MKKEEEMHPVNFCDKNQLDQKENKTVQTMKW